MSPAKRKGPAPSRDPSDRTVERMHRRLAAHRSRLDHLLITLASREASEEELHEAHRELRRLRLDGALWVEVAPPGRAAGYAETDAGLRELSRRIGAARDDDVGSRLASRLARGPRPTLAAGDAVALGGGLAARGRRGRRLLARAVQAGPFSDLLDRFDRPLRASLPRAASRRIRSELEEAVTVRLARLERALARAYRRPSRSRLHRLRVALRTVRLLDQSRRAVNGTPPIPATPAVRALQARLGDLHDHEVLRRSARRLLTGARRARVDRGLRRASRALRRVVVHDLGTRPLRRDLERLVRSGPD